MSWKFWLPSGSTPTVVDRVVRMTKETNVCIVSDQYDYNKHILSSTTTYYVSVVSILSNGENRTEQIYNRADNEEDANTLYEFVVKHNGVNTYKEVLKEQKIDKKQ